jgi:DNA-binding transcriptional MerR regulator
MMRKSDIGQPVTQPTVGSDVVWLTSKTPDPLMKNEVLTIGQMVKKFGVTPRTLRFYEGKGLLAPVRNGRARVYTQADQQRLLLILKGRKLGFTVSEISQMLVAAEDRRGPPHSLKILRGKCLEQIELLERQLNDTHEALAEMRRLITC